MAAVSLKYQALRSRFDSLVGAIKSDIGKVARKMFEKELISSDNRRAAENGMINIEDRATKLLDLVLLKVEENEIHYDVFVAILEDIPVLKSQANQLKQAICLHGAIGQRRENYERFPYLDLGRLTEPELKHFTDRLVEDTYNIMTKFGNLVGSVFDSLTKKQISAEQLGTFICTSWSKPYPLPRDHVSQFRCAKHIFDIQYLLVFEYNYISFIKFEILQSIIETYRLPEDKMTTYLSEFSSFCRRSVFEVPSDVIQKISPSSDAKFTVKVSNTYFGETTGEGKRFTMQDLIDVQRDIEKIIGHRFVYVNDIKKGCIEITFSSHVSMLQPLKQLEQLFSKNGLTVIKASTKIKVKFLILNFVLLWSVKKLVNIVVWQNNVLHRPN